MLWHILAQKHGFEDYKYIVYSRSMRYVYTLLITVLVHRRIDRTLPEVDRVQLIIPSLVVDVNRLWDS